MPELTTKSYEELTANFDWSIAERELGYEPGQAINIGWMCSDRICHLGMADKVALFWEDFQGNHRPFTFDDLRVLSNTVAQFVCDLGIKPGERVCLFMDRMPEFYIGALAILKIGAVAQPLFSAFGDESLLVRLQNADTSAIITQKKHRRKCGKSSRNCQPEAHHHGGSGKSPLQNGNWRSTWRAPGSNTWRFIHQGRIALDPSLHVRNHGPAQGCEARSLFAHFPVPDRQVGARPSG